MHQEIEELYLRDGQDLDFIPQQVKWYVKNLETWKSTAEAPEDLNEPEKDVKCDDSSSQSSISQYSHSRPSSKSHRIHSKCGFKFDGAPFAPPSRVARETQVNWVQPKWTNPNSKIEITMSTSDCPQEGISYNGFQNAEPSYRRNNNAHYDRTPMVSLNLSDCNISIKKSVESCIASIRNAKMVPFPRSSEILGIY